MKIKRILNICILAIPALGLLGGCTTNAYTGERQVSSTGVGVGAGAAGGAILGQIIGGNTTATLVGAGIGAAAGGLVGAYMDHQTSELRSQLQGTGVSVQRVGKDIRLIMPGDITFATNSSDITPKFYNTLNSVAIVLKKYNKTVVEVAGYTDNVGTADYNQRLSERRAQSVKSYLVSQGVNSGRFSVVGYGERNPVASNSTADGRSANRRVEITIHQIK